MGGWGRGWGNPQSLSSLELQCPCRSVNYHRPSCLKQLALRKLSFSSFWGFELSSDKGQADQNVAVSRMVGEMEKESFCLCIQKLNGLGRISDWKLSAWEQNPCTVYELLLSLFRLFQNFLLLTNNGITDWFINSYILSVFADTPCAKHYTIKTGHFCVTNIFKLFNVYLRTVYKCWIQKCHVR